MPLGADARFVYCVPEKLGFVYQPLNVWLVRVGLLAFVRGEVLVIDIT